MIPTLCRYNFAINACQSSKKASEYLKNPLLWLAQAEAISQAAVVLVGEEQSFDNVLAERQAFVTARIALQLSCWWIEA
ncbi:MULTISPECIES: hypothetical protein [Burkholderia]|uniref:hypothetical protein n=1 Tax=Burkholderia TaxID=32008 RepID=UPI001641D824|nr:MULTISPECIES: hypothetical protein [Burkholderia]MBR7911746.1 hypothetical protein [Burkholderia vietnamiensis]HDR9274559.1 hypothetical protein [Burkholderia vietnamiensis]